MQEILNEKYRPQEFDDVIGLDARIPQLVASGNIPHMLFEGPAGTGKTTTAKIIVRKLNADVLILNASKERGIDTIRDRIEPFAMKASDQLKIVFLDEFDATTPQFQTALRNFMETYARNTRFIATCNYKNKIILPLQSRFESFKFAPMDKDAIGQRINEIAQIEGITIEDGAIEALIKKFRTDIRGMVNVLNSVKGGKLTNNIVMHESTALKLLAMAKDRKWSEMRQMLLDNPVEFEELIEQMDALVFANNQVPMDVKRRANMLFADTQFKMNFSFNKEMVFAAMLGQLTDIFQW